MELDAERTKERLQALVRLIQHEHPMLEPSLNLTYYGDGADRQLLSGYVSLSVHLVTFPVNVQSEEQYRDFMALLRAILRVIDYP